MVHRRGAKKVLLGLLLAGAWGCGGGDDTGGGESADLQKYVGTYADRAKIGQITETPAGRSTTLTTFHGLTDIALEGGQLVASQIGCHTDVETDGSIYGKISDVLLETTPPLRRVVTVVDEGGEVRLIGAQAFAVLGARLQDDAKEALPTKPDDPRVWDQDEDGQPGITVQLISGGKSLGDIYAVWRQVDAWNGTLNADGLLTGVITDNSEQSLIGASNPAFISGAKATVEPDPGKNSYTLVKIDQKLDCASLMATLKQVFVDE